MNKRSIAAHLSVSQRSLELWHRQGLPSILVGNRRRYKVSEVETWLRERS